MRKYCIIWLTLIGLLLLSTHLKADDAASPAAPAAPGAPASAAPDVETTGAAIALNTQYSLKQLMMLFLPSTFLVFMARQF